MQEEEIWELQVGKNHQRKTINSEATEVSSCKPPSGNGLAGMQVIMKEWERWSQIQK